VAVSPKRKYHEGRGSRKRATARVRIYEGNETSVVNGIPLEEYFKGFESRIQKATRPLVVAGLADKMFFSAHVQGGGTTGQIGAIQMGLARALVESDDALRTALAKEDLLSRDPREKERKKYFLKKARKRPQFSKR
jgi:small subunit ribosomal protein S9